MNKNIIEKKFYKNLLATLNSTQNLNNKLTFQDESVNIKNILIDMITPKRPIPNFPIDKIKRQEDIYSFPFFILRPALIAFAIILILFFSYLFQISNSKNTFISKKIYPPIQKSNQASIKKNLFSNTTVLNTSQSVISFQLSKNIFFTLGNDSQLTFNKKTKTLYLKKGKLIGEFISKNKLQNLNYTIIANAIRIKVIGTKFYIENNNQKTTIFVEHGHLQVTSDNKTFDLLSQSSAIVSNQKTMIDHFPNYVKIPFNVKTNLSQNDIVKIKNFNLSKSIQKLHKKTISPSSRYSFISLDNFETYKSNTKLNGDQWDIWDFNSIVERPTIVTEKHGNQICQLKFTGTNAYSEAGIKAIVPFTKKYPTHNIAAIQIKLKGKLSTKNQLLIRIYEKNGNAFQHRFSKTETAHLFNGKWNNLTLPNQESFWEYSTASNQHTPNLKKINHFTNLEKLLIGIINKTDQQPHTLYFDDLSFVQKQ